MGLGLGWVIRPRFLTIWSTSGCRGKIVKIGKFDHLPRANSRVSRSRSVPTPLS